MLTKGYFRAFFMVLSCKKSAVQVQFVKSNLADYSTLNNSRRCKTFAAPTIICCKFFFLFFLRRPWLTVAFIFTDFTRTESQDNSKHNETFNFNFHTLLIQYCACGTPSALFYYSNNINNMNTTFLTQSTYNHGSIPRTFIGRYSIVFSLRRFDSILSKKTIFDRQF